MDTVRSRELLGSTCGKLATVVLLFLLWRPRAEFADGQITADRNPSSLKNHEQQPLCMPWPSNRPDSGYFKKNGSVVIGGLFPLFRKPEDGDNFPFADVSNEGIRQTCKQFRQPWLVDTTQVFAFFINHVYHGVLNSSVPGRSVDLGYTLADSCSSLFVSSRMALRFTSEVPLVGRKSFCGIRDGLLPRCPRQSVLQHTTSDGTAAPNSAEDSTGGTPPASGNVNASAPLTCPNGTSVPSRNMAIAVGLTESSVVLPVSTIFTIEKLTHISPSATGNGFINHSGGQLPYFFRTVAPDESQAQALVDIVKHFKWDYVIALASSNDNYGTPGLIKLQDAANEAGVYIAYSTTFNHEDPLIGAVIKDIVDSLILYNEAKAVVLFARSDEAKVLFKAIIERRQSLSQAGKVEEAEKLDKMWLGSDYWGTSRRLRKMPNVSVAVPVALVLRPRLPLKFSTFIDGLADRYVNHLLSLNTSVVRAQEDNPWLCRFWEEVFHCDDACSHDYIGRKNVSVSCDNPDFHLTPAIIEDVSSRLGWTRSTVAALELSLRAMKILLDSIPADTDPRNVAESLLKLANGNAMREAVRKVTFPCDGVGESECLLLANTSEPAPAFSILNFVGESFVDVGYWDMDASRTKLHLNKSNIIWSDRITSNVTSTCTKQCGFGQGTKDTQDRPSCTDCVNCSAKYRAPVGGVGSCEPCGSGERASANWTSCVPLPRDFLSWSDPIGIALTAVVVVCMILVLFTLTVFCYHRASPVAKASDYHLMVLILIGMLVGYAVSLLQIGRPSMLHCTIARLAQSPPFIFTTATLLIKTSRLARMAIAAQQMVTFTRKWTLSIPAQVVFICIVSLVGIALELALTLTKYPTSKLDIHEDVAYLLCDYDKLRSAVLDLYIVVLILITSVFAFITRKMPMNFNEARHIFLTTFCLCAVWAMLAPPIYFSDTQYVPVLYALRLITHMAAIWLFLFTPRLYIFLFRKHRNSVYADQPGRGGSRKKGSSIGGLSASAVSG